MVFRNRRNIVAEDVSEGIFLRVNKDKIGPRCLTFCMYSIFLSVDYFIHFARHWSQITIAPSHKFCTLEWQDEVLQECIHLAHLSRTGKSEIRISKLETNSNHKNFNDQNGKQRYQLAFVLNFEHLNFDIVSINGETLVVLLVYFSKGLTGDVDYIDFFEPQRREER